MAEGSDVTRSPAPSEAFVPVRELSAGDRIKVRLSKPCDTSWTVQGIETKAPHELRLDLVRGTRRQRVHPTEVVSLVIDGSAMLERLS